jgi:hypothetical protein
MSLFLGPEFGSNKDLIFYFDSANPKSYTSGTTMYNLGASSSYDMQFSVAPTYTSNNCGTLGFNGTTQQGVINGINYPLNTDDDFTLQTWIYIPTGASWSNAYYSNIIGRGAYDGFIGIVRSSLADNQIRGYVRSQYSWGNIATTITRDSWNQITLTMNAGTLSLYKNGTIASTYVTGFTYSIYDNNMPYVLAGSLAASGDSGNTMSGTVSIVSLWNRALSVQEISKTYEITKTRFGNA